MNFKNQLSIFNPGNFENTSISIVGVGAIGSFTTLILSKMGIKNINAYDTDTIKEHNIPNQFYKLNQIGLTKTTALKQVVGEYADTHITENGKLTNNTTLASDIVIVCTDNMRSRKLAYNKAKLLGMYLIDARMNGHTYRVYTVSLNNELECSEYEKTLYSDKTSDEGQCTEKTIIYNVAEISSKIANQVRKVLTEQPYTNMLAYDFINDLLIKKNWRENENGKNRKPFKEQLG